MNVLIVVAHSDDQILGPGGTVAKYAKEGHTIHTVIFSYGELSHPHFKRDVIRNIRIEETEKADKIVGGSGVEFLALSEGKFKDEFQPEKFKQILQDFSPDKIFTHADDEQHPDHVAVNKFVLQCYDELNLSCEVYNFAIWRFFRIKKRHNPRLIVDVTDTFKKKIEALSAFKSQKVAMITLTWSVYFKAIIAGMKGGVHFGEEFLKIR